MMIVRYFHYERFASTGGSYIHLPPYFLQMIKQTKLIEYFKPIYFRRCKYCNDWFKLTTKNRNQRFCCTTHQQTYQKVTKRGKYELFKLTESDKKLWKKVNGKNEKGKRIKQFKFTNRCFK